MKPHEMKMAAVEFLVFLSDRGIDLKEVFPDVNFPELLHEFELEQFDKQLKRVAK